MMEGTGMVTHCKQQRLAWFQNYLTPKKKKTTFEMSMETNSRMMK